MLDKVSELLHKLEEIKIKSKEELEEYRLTYLSKKGAVSSLFGEFKNVASDKKKEFGQQLNVLKNKV